MIGISRNSGLEDYAKARFLPGYAGHGDSAADFDAGHRSTSIHLGSYSYGRNLRDGNHALVLGAAT